MKQRITSHDIKLLLAKKHNADIAVAECKDGPTWFVNHSRLDFWAMRRSWTTPMITGYEIKVSRSDFLQDKKWPRYLDFCERFYFVCPNGMIDPKEIDSRAGLMWVSTTGNQIYRKKLAPALNKPNIESLILYVLMSRCEINTLGLSDFKHEFHGDLERSIRIRKHDDLDYGRQQSKQIREMRNKLRDIADKANTNNHGRLIY